MEKQGIKFYVDGEEVDILTYHEAVYANNYIQLIIVADGKPLTIQINDNLNGKTKH